MNKSPIKRVSNYNSQKSDILKNNPKIKDMMAKFDL